MAKEKFLIVTTMKNEGPFMLEWIAYNLSIGFTHFLIYTNDCTDGTDEIAMRLEELGIATHVDNNYRGPRNAAPQRYALRTCIKHDRFKEADWVICADADEFLNIRTAEGTLDDFVEKSGPADAISLCWKLFGHGGHRHYEDLPLIEQFFRCAPEDRFTNFRGAGLKTMFRNNGAFTHMGVHRPKIKQNEGDDPDTLYSHVTWRDCGGNTFDANKVGWKAWTGFSHKFARLHHYAIRSGESFLVKRDRGRTNHFGGDQGVEYFSAMNANHTVDHSILRHAPRALTELAKLKSDKRLAELHRGAVAWHREKIKDVTTRPEWADFIKLVYGEAAE